MEVVVVVCVGCNFQMFDRGEPLKHLKYDPFIVLKGRAVIDQYL